MDHEAEAASGKRYQVVTPSPALWPWVSYYVIVDDCQAGCHLPMAHLPPTPGAELHINLEGLPARIDSDGSSERALRSMFCGPRTRIERTCNDDGPIYTLAIGFRVGGWCDLVCDDPGSLTGVYAEAADLFGSLESELTARLEYSRGHDLVAAAEAWLHEVIRQRGRDEPQTAWLRQRLMAATPAETAAEMGISRRQLDRRFRQTFGLTPNTFQRLARLQAVHAAGYLSRMASAPVRDAADLAAYAGYYDQSHLDRDLRQFIGLSLTQLRDRLDAGDAEFELFNTAMPTPL